MYPIANHPYPYWVIGQWGTGSMGHMGNGAYGQCGHRGQWGTGDMGHMANDAHRGYGGTRGIGHIGNRSHGQWGSWAMGLMDDLNIFVHNIINTGWILTKILLDIDIDVFYLNTGRFFHDGLN